MTSSARKDWPYLARIQTCRAVSTSGPRRTDPSSNKCKPNSRPIGCSLTASGARDRGTRHAIIWHDWQRWCCWQHIFGARWHCAGEWRTSRASGPAHHSDLVVLARERTRHLDHCTLGFDFEWRQHELAQLAEHGVPKDVDQQSGLLDWRSAGHRRDYCREYAVLLSLPSQGTYLVDVTTAPIDEIFPF